MLATPSPRSAAVAPGSPLPSNGFPPYHAISPWRFLFFTFLTAGWYPMYWSYRTWVGVRARDGTRIWPIARALALGASTLDLARHLNAQAIARVPVRDALIGASATAYFFGGGLVPTELPGSLLYVARAVFLVPLVVRMRHLSDPETLRRLDRWRPRDALVVLVGAPLWGLHAWIMPLSRSYGWLVGP